MARGKLIVMEGLDGSGKATQTGLLCQYLESRGRRVRHIEFPDYREPSSALVKMYLNKEFGSNPGDVNAYAASSFYAVDRYASFLRFWRKDYLSGATSWRIGTPLPTRCIRWKKHPGRIGINI